MSAPSPGWYPDPTTPGSLRFYDGDQWTKSVVTVPANGQLTPDMIATGRKIMQDKASAKLADGPITPRALGSNDDVGAAASHASSTRSARSAASASPAAHGGSPAATTRSSLRASATSRAAGASAAGANSRAAAATASAADAIASASTANVPTAASSKAAVTPESSTATSPGTPAESSSATQASAGVNTAGKRSAFAPRAFDASALSPSSGSTSGSASSAASDSAPFSKSQGTGEPSGDSATSAATTTDSVTPKWATDEPQDAHNAAFANDVADSSGTSKSAAKKGPSTKILIIAILVVVAVIAAVLFALLGGKDEKAGAPSAAYKALGLKSDFGCEAIAEEVKELSRSGTNEIPVISLKDISMTNDKRDTFELPTQSGKYTTAFECEGVASYDDGETQKLTFDMSADKAGKLWTYYTPRTK